jgi:hypothetical protein
MRLAILAILMASLDFSIFSQDCSPQSVARFCILALGQDGGRIELMHGCHTPSMRGMTYASLESNQCIESATGVRTERLRIIE